MKNEFWRNKRVLVTGHTGFKGAWLSLWLSKLGAQVTGLALAPPTQPNLFDLAHLNKKITSHTGDIRDFNVVRQTLEKAQPEVIFHMAAQALVLPSYDDPIGTYATNVMGTVHLLEAARQANSVRAVINVTSDKCYENREWAWGYRENEAMGGYDPYSSSKGCSELVTAAYRRSFYKTVGLASARAGNVIGGGDWARDRLIPDCIRALESRKPIEIRNPQSIRPWQHVLEPLSGYLFLAQAVFARPSEFSGGWNFGPPVTEAKPVSWIADQITHLWGDGAAWQHIKNENPPHEAHYLKLDCTLAHAQLGWHPRLNMEQTMKWVVEWYKAHSQGKNLEHLCIQQIEEFEGLANENRSFG